MGLHEERREAEQLLSELDSWSEDELEELPELYQAKAEQFQRLLKTGEE